MEVEDILKNLKNGDNMGGISQQIALGFHADVATWPTKPTAEAANFSANGILTGAIVMKTGKRMFPFYVTEDTGGLGFELVGPKDGKSFKWTLKVFHPALQAKILGFVNAGKNDDLVSIVPDSDGELWLLGDALRAAHIDTASGGTGDSNEGQKGTTLEITFKAAKLLRYESTIPYEIAGSGSGA